MAHLLGIYLPNHKNLKTGLTMIYGLGKSSVLEICSSVGLNPSSRIQDLTDYELNRISRHVESNYLIESELSKKENFSLKRLLTIKSYRGLRHYSGLPVRGQRTKSNARTQKRIGKRIKRF
uniref:Ribosomal protein S13 n=1 Tax=Jakoba libera TaxID=143017 RepID=M4QA14_JAKLI|nr:ribosomal protein S13 [Jakoba libera]AGH24201.1 ribosomal protein S13 [Jakoba libera]